MKSESWEAHRGLKRWRWSGTEVGVSGEVKRESLLRVDDDKAGEVAGQGLQVGDRAGREKEK